ncbi:MAG: hypothetical protein KIT33_02845 [Candidatus Kapabacteria bacterium]|nr:hypothetical protein [Ignavibacteriota bacterium]MCW5883887.1 hypothetical protein [Candidatus Kapabacteria bacterium]
MKISIHKFGGSVLNTAQGLQCLKGILSDDSVKNVVIISALGKTSSNLKNAIFQSENGGISEAKKNVNFLLSEHKILAKSIINEPILSKYEYEIEILSKNIYKILESVAITREVSGRTLDRFLAFGEELAAILIKYYFADNKSVHFLDAREIIATNSDFTEAKIDKDLTRINIDNKLVPILCSCGTVITQGFIASDNNGNTTTMGFESSNLTATVIADCLDAHELTLWSDIDGIYTADPKIFSNTSLVPYLSYDTAQLAGNSGLKLIYPAMIDIAKLKNIKLIFRNGLTSSEKFSVISSDNINDGKLLILNTNIRMEGWDNEVIIINSQKSRIIQFILDKFPELLDSGIMAFESGFNNKLLKIYFRDEQSALKFSEEIIGQL